VVNLHKYMILHGLKFSKSDHVFFIHVLYGLLTTKHVDTVTLDTFAKVSPAFGRVWIVESLYVPPRRVSDP
jgi:hypothetical protein